MTNSVVLGLNELLSGKRKLVRNSKDIINVITLIDLIVILPSFIVFLALNIGNLSTLGIAYRVVVPSFLLFLPFAIVLAGFFLTRKKDLVDPKKEGEEVVPTLIFLLFIFSMFSIYIPVIQKLSVLLPSIGTLNIIESSIVFLFLVFVIKNVTSILKG